MSVAHVDEGLAPRRKLACRAVQAETTKADWKTV